MKFRTSEKAIRENYTNIICIGYCDLQNLLNYKPPIAYTCGVYGWNADIYEINNSTVICTGYRPIGKIRPSYELTCEYDKRAKKIVYASGEYSEKKGQLDNLLADYIGDVMKEYNDKKGRVKK